MAKTNKSTRRKRRKFGRGVLVVLSSLFLMSALLRLGGGAGAAIAREVTDIVGGKDAEHGTVSMSPGSCEPEPEIASLLNALRKREASVESREAAVSEELLALKRAREEIAREMSALRATEAQLEETLALADGAAEDDLSRLTRMYELMKPKEAAPLFQEMDPVFAAGFLGRMQPERAAAILAGMEPKGAYTLSLILAGRNGSVPTE